MKEPSIKVVGVLSVTLFALVAAVYYLYSKQQRERKRYDGENQKSNDDNILSSGAENSQQELDCKDIAPTDSSKQQAPNRYTSEDIKGSLRLCESGNLSQMTQKDAEVLTHLLSVREEQTKERTLSYIGNAAAFTTNQNLLREAGALARLIQMLDAHGMAVKVGHSVHNPSLLSSLLRTINNLAANEANQPHLQAGIPNLIDFATQNGTDESVKLSALQALTNLSVTSNYHGPYTALVQHLYECLDTGSPAVQQQALKVLVNLSNNKLMVPHLLAAKAPSCVLTLLVPSIDENLLLRWTFVLANIVSTQKEQKITAEVLPPEYKAASPETMYTVLYGVAHSARLKSKIFVLCRHQNKEVSSQATKIYGILR